MYLKKKKIDKSWTNLLTLIRILDKVFSFHKRILTLLFTKLHF